MKELGLLSDHELCGQLIVGGLAGTTLSSEESAALRDGLLGGVVLFARNVGTLDQVHTLCDEIAGAAPQALPPWIGIDQEGGRVRRLKQGVVELPAMRRLGQLDDVDLTRDAAALLGRQLQLLGFNLNFAPVADVDSNPGNPVIGDRAFGSDPRLVVRHARAVMDAFAAAGIVSCIKHYPGHGDTSVDSHLALPTVEADSVRLRQVELYPFERLAPWASAAMSAHVRFPALDAAPATFSPRLLTTLLKREFLFRGVLFSDDLEMGALSEQYSIEESAVRAIGAGCDNLLICSKWDWISRARSALVAECAREPGFRARCVEALKVSLVARRAHRPSRAGWRLVQQRFWPEELSDVPRRLKRLPRLASKNPRL